MPGRHVRFSTENTYYSPYSEPSSLPNSYSTFSSYPTSHGVPSKPTFAAPRRSRTISAPRVTGVPHRALEHTSHPLIQYDIALPPSTMTSIAPLPSSVLHEPATYPPTQSMTIVSSHLPWGITVTASAQGYGAFITVADVLAVLHTSLRTRVSKDEYERLGSHRLMRRVSDAYTERYMRLRGHRGYAEEKTGGLRRVDFLMGQTRFRGLSPSTSQPDVWRFHVA
ncbi:hypothetical protein MKEN_00288400 [Mycena kentingensis (nom. inval.)]|nr:hypothetical protein MKEN_00288400 [Mycena kentingensis (nom. inval.)]